MTEPLTLVETQIKPEWIDEYGHMNVAHYVTVCDQATWAFWHYVNDDRRISERGGHEYVVLENHVHYINEVLVHTPVHVTTQLLACDDKRFILFHRLWNSGDDLLSATNEVKAMGFNLNERRIETFTRDVRDALQQLFQSHSALPAPEQAGQGIVLNKR